MATATVLAPKVRTAELSLVKGIDESVLRVAAPGDLADKEFAVLGRSILELIRKQTGCNCLSGRIKVVIEDDFNDVIRVDLARGVG